MREVQIDLELDGSRVPDLLCWKLIADNAWGVESVVEMSLLSCRHSGVSCSRSNHLER